MGGYCDRGLFHALAGYYPEGGCYEVSCTCGDKFRAGPLFTEPMEAAADALLKLREHIAGLVLSEVT